MDNSSVKAPAGGKIANGTHFVGSLGAVKLSANVNAI
jgi:hypothetical protein